MELEEEDPAWSVPVAVTDSLEQLGGLRHLTARHKFADQSFSLARHLPGLHSFTFGDLFTAETLFFEATGLRLLHVPISNTGCTTLRSCPPTKEHLKISTRSGGLSAEEDLKEMQRLLSSAVSLFPDARGATR